MKAAFSATAFTVWPHSRTLASFDRSFALRVTTGGVAHRAQNLARPNADKLLNAVRGIHGITAHVHDRFRSLAELVQNPARSLAAIQTQPVRKVRI